tara:strand:- start:1124 stop:1726 length:603 start_codon:yes stop_codon:yes gene_type:complete
MEGATMLNCPLTKESIDKCFAHMDFLLHWNRTHNLTSVCDPADFVTLHLLDSLTVAPLIKGTNILDIGSGGGFPGIPLALALPHTRWTLLDSRGKRARFLQEAANHLGLKKVAVVQGRVEDYRPEVNFDTLVARAVSPLARFVKETRHLWTDGVRVIAMKGRGLDSELGEISSAMRERAEVVNLNIPGESVVRRAVVFQN